jgi:hypothetical protein
MAYDDLRAVSLEDALTMDEWRRRIMGGRPASERDEERR